MHSTVTVVNKAVLYIKHLPRQEIVKVLIMRKNMDTVG